MTSFKLSSSNAIKEEDVIAITTPVSAPDGTISEKTPIFHLPVYKVSLQLEGQDEPITFHCDLADITDLIGKLKVCENLWKRK